MHRCHIRALALKILLLVAALWSTGCNESQPLPDGPIKLGIITSLTGSNAAFGQAHKAGYTIAVHDINSRGGVNGRKLQLVYFDDQSKPDQAVQGVSKLVDQDHVPLLLGAYSSENTLAIIPAVTQKQVPLIMPTAQADNVMDTGSRWVFRLCAGSGAFATATLDFLKHNGDPKTLAIVYEDTNFGRASRKAMSDAAKAAGLNVVAEEAYQAKSPDYESLLKSVKARNPEVIYFASYLLDASTLMRQAKQVNLNAKYFTSAGTGFATPEFPTEKGAGQNAEYTFSVSQWLPSAPWKGSKEFDEKYFKLLNAHPAYHGMQAYAALMVAKEAVARAGSLDAKALRDAIRVLDIPETPFGPVKFDARGQNAHPVLVTQVLRGSDGKLDHKVVWPSEIAETKPVILAPDWPKR